MDPSVTEVSTLQCVCCLHVFISEMVQRDDCVSSRNAFIDSFSSAMLYRTIRSLDYCLSDKV